MVGETCLSHASGRGTCAPGRSCAAPSSLTSQEMMEGYKCRQGDGVPLEEDPSTCSIGHCKTRHFPSSCVPLRRDQTDQSFLTLAHKTAACLRQGVLHPFFACCSKVLRCLALLTKVSVLFIVCFLLAVHRTLGRSSSYCWLSTPSPVPWRDPVAWKG